MQPVECFVIENVPYWNAIMYESESTLTINWVLPDIQSEQWEFFHHPAKQPFYQEHSITWEQILARLPDGRLTGYPRSGTIEGIPVRLSHHSYDDYSRYLAKAKRGYRINYNRMEEALQKERRITLPAPILLQVKGECLLFSGYRRLCLAWNYGMIPYVLLIPLIFPSCNSTSTRLQSIGKL